MPETATDVTLTEKAAAEIGNIIDQQELDKDAVCLRLGEPAGIAVMQSGEILLADTNNHRILIMDPAARTYRTWLA